MFLHTITPAPTMWFERGIYGTLAIDDNSTILFISIDNYSFHNLTFWLIYMGATLSSLNRLRSVKPITTAWSLYFCDIFIFEPGRSTADHSFRVYIFIFGVPWRYIKCSCVLYSSDWPIFFPLSICTFAELFVLSFDQLWDHNFSI